MMRKRRDERAELCAEFYKALISALRYVAERCGYALAVHGSLKRDIDLIACPWRDSAIPAENLIEHLKKATEVIIGTARTCLADEGKQPEKKPCGRLAWSFYLTYDDKGPYLDISVMPFGNTKEEH
jgi:hypothetical protein